MLSSIVALLIHSKVAFLHGLQKLPPSDFAQNLSRMVYLRLISSANNGSDAVAAQNHFAYLKAATSRSIMVNCLKIRAFKKHF
jgi:hypothetical protein